MKRWMIALATLLVLATVPAMAQDNPGFFFRGPHPVPEQVGGGFCTEPLEHHHTYSPLSLEFYRVVNGVYHFIGDPVYHGYSGNLYYYDERHPIDTVYGGGYCYIHGPHRHLFRPSLTHYRVVNGYYRYYGPWSPSFISSRYIYPSWYYRAPRYYRYHLTRSYRPLSPYSVYRNHLYRHTPYRRTYHNRYNQQRYRYNQNRYQHNRTRYQHNQQRYQHNRTRYQHNQPRYQHNRTRYQHNQQRYQQNRTRYQHNKQRYQHNRTRIQHNRNQRRTPQNYQNNRRNTRTTPRTTPRTHKKHR